MRHIKIMNKEDRKKLPLTAKECAIINFCIAGDWDKCSASFDFCIKDGERPPDKPSAE